LNRLVDIVGDWQKRRIYKSAVRPVLTYLAETRPDFFKTNKTMETTEMRTL
jgi:hypothetical protein